MKKTIRDLDVYEKRVLVRVDFNVPMKDGVITSNDRIVKSLPTINELLQSRAKVILCSHFGRPQGTKNLKYSLKPVFEELKKLMPQTEIMFCEESVGDKAEKMANELKSGEVLLLENIRFYPEEETCEENFVSSLAKLADLFVLDAFGTAHRKHASTFGIAKKLPSAVGKLVETELNMFDKLFNTPKKPIVAVLGGAKISDKIDVTKNLLNKVNTLIIGGGMCFTFLKCLKAEVGNSLVDESKLDFCYEVIKEAINKKVKLILPIDFVCANDVNSKEAGTFKLGKIPSTLMALDIGDKTIKLFNKYLKRAKTVIWNGPMGVYENPLFKNGTKRVAEIIAKNKKCFSVVGGGDVVSAIKEFSLEDSFSFVSTGGGASLKLLEGKNLVAVDAIENE